MNTRFLPIIGNITKGVGGYTATEPITTQQLAQVIKSPWCQRMQTTDGPNSAPGSVTYYLLAVVDGDVLAVTGTAVGSR